MDGKNTDLTVVVCSCDKYADILPPHISLFRKFWPDCPFETVLVTESNPHVDGFDRTVSLGCGKTWCGMLAEALGVVDTRFVLLLMDDYLLSSPVDTMRFLRRLDEAKRFGAASLRLNPNPPGRRPFKDSDLKEMPKNVAYCVTCQATIWSRDFLLRLAWNNESAWEFERRGSFQTGDESRPLLVTPSKEFPFVDAVHKGYWERSGVALCRANGIAPDLARRPLPPIGVRLIEGLKAFIFAVVPTTLLVKLQNRFGLGATKTPAVKGSGGNGIKERVALK